MPRWRQLLDPWLLLILAAASVALFARLDHRPFWQDEAETACLARNTNQFGVPVATDGVNIISQENNREFGEDHLWRWSPWLQIGLTAASFRLLGESTWTGRLPFALCGWLTIGLVYVLIRRVSGRVVWARFSAFCLACFVPFLLHARQCRYYAAGALLTVLVLFAVSRAGRKTPVLAAAGLALLFYLNYIVFFAFTCGLALAFLVQNPRRFTLRQVALGGAVLAVLAAPGLWFHRVGSMTGLLQVNTVLRNFLRSGIGFVEFILPWPILVALLGRWLTVRKAAVRPDEQYVRFLLVLMAGNVLALALTPNFFFRYLIHLAPAAAIVMGWCLFRLWTWRRTAAGLLAAAAVLTNGLNLLPLERFGANGPSWPGERATLPETFIPLMAFVTELRQEYPDVNAGLIQYLNHHAHSGDTVLVSYGDLPLQFYTRLRVIGGFQKMQETLDPLPEWVVLRRRIFLTRENEEPASVRLIRNLDLEREYNTVPLAGPDEPFGNRVDPFFHRFIPPGPSFPRLAVYRKKTAQSLLIRTFHQKGEMFGLEPGFEPVVGGREALGEGVFRGPPEHAPGPGGIGL